MVSGGFDAVLEKISGFHVYDLEKGGKEGIGLRFASESLCEMTGYEKEELEEDYGKIIYGEDREAFAELIEKLREADGKGSAEYRIVKKDGNIIHVREEAAETGAVLVDVTDITRDYQEKKDRETQRYMKALADVYDKIFEYNFGTNTVKCLYSNNSPVFRSFENVPMQLEEATKKWIEEIVEEKDTERVLSFFEAFKNTRMEAADGKPPMITYMAKSSVGQVRKYSGIFLKLDKDVSFYCCRRDLEEEAQEALKAENTNLKENMKKFVSQFTDGAVAFKVTADGYALPLYYSDNVCEFFGYAKTEWKKLMENGMPIEQFVAHCDTDYEEFEKLLCNGEGEFSYRDVRTGERKAVRAICSQKEPDGNSPRYIMLYSMDASDNTEGSAPGGGKSEVIIRTFGYFDVFVGNKPIAFRNKKSKELFALLVDRRGGFVTSDEAIGFLWEDETVNPVTLSRYRKVALRLKNTLEAYGISDIVEAVDGKRRIVSEKVCCDLYDYLTGKEEYAHLFKGSYLINYSWGEMTLGNLFQE